MGYNLNGQIKTAVAGDVVVVPRGKSCSKLPVTSGYEFIQERQLINISVSMPLG
jgi:hypothetical protein